MGDVLLLSGGVDSAYLLDVVRPHGVGIALFVDYGQPAARREERAVNVLARRADWQIRRVTVSGMPLGEMADGIGAHVVPARNLWLTSIAAAFGTRVWIGVGPQDDRDYEDCRLGFLHALDGAMQTIGCRLQWSQALRHERVAALRASGALPHCWSCYGPGPEPCGECASCLQ